MPNLGIFGNRRQQQQALAGLYRRGVITPRGFLGASFPNASQSEIETGAGLLAAGAATSVLAGTLGAESVLAGVLGYAVLPLALAGIAEILVGVFQGRPKMLDTVQAIARLGLSQDPEIQNLVRDFAIYARNGEPFSSSNPQVQNQIRTWIAGAIQTIGQRQGRPLTPAQVSALDLAIRNTMNSHVATTGLQVDAVIRQLGLAVNSRPPALAMPRRTPLRYTNIADYGVGTRQVTPPVALPPPRSDIVAYLEDLAFQHPYLQLSGCVALAVAGQETLALRCLEELLVAQTSQHVKAILRNAENYIRSLLHRQPPPPIPVRREVATLDQTKPCPECERGLTTKQRAQLQEIRAQQREVAQEIQTEQDQQLEQQLAQQQSELSDLAQLEEQPANQRDIGRELQTKREIQRQLQQEQRELEQPQAQQGQQANVRPPGEPVPTLQENQAARQIERQIEKIEQAKKTGVQFCVGCASQEDAILFLNGEPSQCSVVPGTTKEMNVNG